MLTKNQKSKNPSQSGTWKLQDAKARFSEVVRKAQTEGPQHVTVHGKDAAVVVSASEYAKAMPRKTMPRKTKSLTGIVLVEAMQEARRLGLKISSLRTYPAMRPPVTFADDDQ